jgi:hypothetical protein
VPRETSRPLEGRLLSGAHYANGSFAFNDELEHQVPESRRRKKPVTLSQPASTTPKRKGPSPRWLAPLMLVMFGLGILWLVVYYLSAPGEMPLAGGLGGWNLVVGFGFIIVGFVLSTQWR